MSNSGDRRRYKVKDVEKLLGEAVDDWEEESRKVISQGYFGHRFEWEVPGAEVSAEARRALTEPVLSNWDHIEQELSEGTIDQDDLRHGVRMVLQEAANSL